jgi:hypothetical protein
MSKNIQTVIKIVLIFIASAIIAWFTRKIFSDLYIIITKPIRNPGALLLLPLNYYLEGFLISYFLFASTFSFLFIDKKQWWSWLIIIAPLLIISWGMWEMYFWYLVLSAIGFGVGSGIKKLKK